MKIKLTRSKLLFICISMILLFLVINRINIISKSIITNGIVIGYKIWENKTFPEDTESAPIIEFQTENSIITFTAQKNLKYDTGDLVKVIYNESDPYKANIYSFYGFWLEPLIISFIPIIIVSALILTFISKKDIVVIGRNNGSHILKINRKSIEG